MRKKIPIFFLLICFISSSALILPPAEAGEDASLKGWVASAQPLATQAGLEILRAGGNAIDAAIAVQMVLNVTEPHASGIGGGCFLLYYQAKTHQVIALDGREEAPYAASPEMFLDQKGTPLPFFPERITGGRSVGVPGCLKALHKAWKQYGSGRLEWKLLFQAAIEIAENGFPVSAKLAEAIEEQKPRLVLFPESYQLLFNEDGTPKKEGDLLVDKNLGQTFRLVAEQGPSVFYEGEIARDLVKAVRESPVAPGLMTLDDLKNYDAPMREPVYGTYRGLEIFSMPPPSSGGTTLIEILNMLEPYPVGKMKRTGAEFIHLFSEIQKLAFADRNRYLADPDFSEVPRQQLLSKTLAEERRLSIDPLKVSGAKAEPVTLVKLGNQSTSHLSILDGEGNLLAMTTTIEHIFGSALAVPGRGFFLNNELTDFSADPFIDVEKKISAPNRPEGGRKTRHTSLDIPKTEGGKRPLSSMTPTLILKDGKPYAALGSPGGTQIIGIVLNTLVNLVDFKMNPEDAVAAPRIINRNGPVELEQELYKKKGLLKRLEEKGHEVLVREPFGNAQILVIKDAKKGKIEGASDPRGEGLTKGS